MAVVISCPHCSQPVDAQARYCKNCGVDLALAAVFAERDFVSPQIRTGLPISPEILVPRLGEYMLEKGLLQSEQLQQALNYQNQRASQGQPILLGEALLELGFIHREILDQVITVQILQLQTALNEANRRLEKRVQERTRDLQEALERLTELNQLKSNFIANISHELRTPLTHIKGYLDILADGGLGELTPQQKEALEVLKRSEIRLERLIEDLIQFSLASRGELALELDAVQLESLIRIAEDRYSRKADANQTRLDVQISGSLPLVRVDQDKIGWVLFQLLDNALKFTPEGGRVLLEASAEDSLVTIVVSDTGIGIPEEKIAEIFEPFHQLDGSTTRRYGGTGLGLAMARRIIEAHGSQLKVQSAANKGSRFEFSLPFLKEMNKEKVAG